MLAESQWPVRSTWRRTERGHRDEEERHDSAAHDGPTEHRSGRHPPSPTALSPLLRYLAPSPSVHPASTSDSCVPLPGFTRSISCSSPIFVQNGARLATAECCRLCHVLLLTFSSLFSFCSPTTLQSLVLLPLLGEPRRTIRATTGSRRRRQRGVHTSIHPRAAAQLPVSQVSAGL